jgi:hypothetical protein
MEVDLMSSTMSLVSVPVGSWPTLAWKALMARAVRGPYRPSTLPSNILKAVNLR